LKNSLPPTPHTKTPTTKTRPPTPPPIPQPPPPNPFTLTPNPPTPEPYTLHPKLYYFTPPQTLGLRVIKKTQQPPNPTPGTKPGANGTAARLPPHAPPREARQRRPPPALGRVRRAFAPPAQPPLDRGRVRPPARADFDEGLTRITWVPPRVLTMTACATAAGPWKGAASDLTSMTPGVDCSSRI